MATLKMADFGPSPGAVGRSMTNIVSVLGASFGA
jgi:hypothetical protein